MPEFPEVRLQVQYLQERLDDWEIEAYGYKGKRQFKNLPTQGRDEVLDAFWKGNVLQSVHQRGKYVVMLTRNGCALFHLMLTGRLTVEGDDFISRYKAWKEPPLPRSKALWLRAVDGRVLSFHTPRWLAHCLVYPGEHRAAELASLQKLGPELMSTPETAPSFSQKVWTLEHFARSAARSSAAIKGFLLDQKKVAGIGNVYACEALYQSGISPHRPCKSLSREELSRLHEAVLSLTERATETGLDYTQIVKIYRREQDPEGREVKNDAIKSRDTFWVPAVQH